MQVNSITNQNFGARIKISKAARADFRDASLISASGTSLSGTGAMSFLPAGDPAHHIQSSAKILDSGSAVAGSALLIGGAAFMKIAHHLLKNGIKNIKIPT